MTAKQTKRGRGWHGDPIGHAMAGKRGGAARAARRKQQTDVR